MFVTLLLPSRMKKKNKYVIWSVFENNFVYVMHCISKFDRATLFRHVSDHVFVFLRSVIQAAIFLDKQHDATGSLTRFSTRQVSPTSAIFPETLGVVSNCTTYTFLQQVTEWKYDSCPCRLMNHAATPTFTHVYLPL
jgi:hypothetical protein